MTVLMVERPEAARPGGAKLAWRRLWRAVLMAAPLLTGITPAQPPAPVRLRCESLVRPLGLDEPRPRLSWELEDWRRGAVQTAYRILVASCPERLGEGKADRWDSGKVESNRTVQVEYAGAPLRSGEWCCWKVRTWDGDGIPSPWSLPSTWSMGLLQPEDWEARWIGDATPPPPLQPAANGYHSAFSSLPDEEKWVVLDLGQAREVDEVVLHPARPFDFTDTPGFCFPLRYRLEGALQPGFVGAVLLVDRSHEDQPAPGTEAVLLPFPPQVLRYLRLVATRLRPAQGDRHALALAELEVRSGGQVISVGVPVEAKDAIESGTWSRDRLVDGDRTSHGPRGAEPLPAPLLRKEFVVSAPVKRAVLHVSALGVYELRLNGRKVGEQELAPEWTDYHTRVQVQTHEVTSELRRGSNALGVILGDGWYAGRLGMAQALSESRLPRAIYGRTPRLILQLVLEEEGGTRTVVSDGSWKSTLRGPLRQADLLDGEVCDLGRELGGWDLPAAESGFSEAGWTPVLVEPALPVALVAQRNEPIRIMKELEPVGLSRPRPGTLLFDLGQNLAGRCRLELSGPAGTTIVLRHGEALDQDGSLYTANLRGAAQSDRVTLAGHPWEVYEPRFTSHGFRYVEVSGVDEQVVVHRLVARVLHSAAPSTSAFKCSNALLNRLWENIQWTQRANLMSVPTDCPQRDERLGWMGDILAFGQTAVFNRDLAAFFSKWMQDVRDAQADDGRFPDFAPHPYGRNRAFTGVPGWGDAGVFVPWLAYLNYEDRRILERSFDSVRRWVEWIRRGNPDLLWRHGRHNDYGDWLNGDTLVKEGWPRQGAAVPKEILATAMFARSTRLLGTMARVLGRQKEAEEFLDLAQDIRDAFNRAFVDAEAAMPGHTQAGYALALAFDLLPEGKRSQARQRLRDGIQAYDHHLSTGFHTTHLALLELSRGGWDEEAYALVGDTRFPSWGYGIVNGATTIWERWDGYVVGRGFQDPGMNSLNHWALGSVGEWMVRTILGINPDPSHPGYGRVLIRPRPGGDLTWARGHYRSIRGTIAVDWRIEGDRLQVNITVPANVSAEVSLPTSDPEGLTEGGQPLEVLPEIGRRAGPPGTVILEVPAGVYRFTAAR